MNTRVEQFKQTIEKACQCKARHVASKTIVEGFEGQVVWDGIVEVFDLQGHPKAMRWSCLGFFDRSRERAEPFPRSLEGWSRISLLRTTAMPHELIAGLEAGAVGVLVLLLVPKRGVDHIRERFADLSSGRRRWLFEPPSWQRAKRPEGARMAVVAAIDVFELGVPLFVAGRLAEQRSAQIYLDRQSRWADTPKALLAAHLKGG